MHIGNTIGITIVSFIGHELEARQKWGNGVTLRRVSGTFSMDTPWAAIP